MTTTRKPKKSEIKYAKLDYIFRYVSNDIIRKKELTTHIPLYKPDDVANYIVELYNTNENNKKELELLKKQIKVGQKKSKNE